MKEQTKQGRRWNAETQCYEYGEFPTGKYLFTDEDRMRIVSEYLQGEMSGEEIVSRYHLGGRHILFNWMDKFVREDKSVSLSGQTKTEESMPKRSSDEVLQELREENDRLRKALELEKLRSKAYDTMIELAENTFNIPIRKKSGTKR